MNLILTKDGSVTLLHHTTGETYHSRHGAIAESKHVFIQAGFSKAVLNKSELYILEVGLGTGLNAFLTYQEALENKTVIHFHALEPYPVQAQLWQKFSFELKKHLSVNTEPLETIHQSAFDEIIRLNNNFQFYKKKLLLQQYLEDSIYTYDLIYFDAFSPNSQPELWSVEIFKSLFNRMKPSGILVTYCAKGIVKRNIKAAGFILETLQGPPGKREMIRAIRP